MLPFLREGYGNPSSVPPIGQEARKAVDEARHHVAHLIGASDAELLFTGGGTESINTAIRGVLGDAIATQEGRHDDRRTFGDA
jgi:cysteine desulfurase